MRVALVNAPLRSIVCDRGVGHQMPLGLLMLGGPLLDAGFEVRLIDAACDHLEDDEIVRRLVELAADVVLISHVGATTAHPCCVRVLQAVRAALPHAVTVYGGVHATYHWESILARHPEVDVVVRGEGEAATLELVQEIARSRPGARDPLARTRLDLSTVQGIAWRRDGRPVMNAGREAIRDLDGWRIGWELVEDWDRYQAFGYGRAAVVQFSRGCPHTCTYCGQWMFWKRWRHRDPTRFVDEIERLHREHDVRFFWIADENPTTDPALWREVLADIAGRRLGIGLCASIRAQDIVRDESFLHLYREAGFAYVLMGVETLADDSLRRIRKDSSCDDAWQAIRLLRRHGILSIVDYMFGLEEETPRTLARALRGLSRYDGDYVNALFVTPHAWTPLGAETLDAPVVETDLSRWDYRHQVLAVKHLSAGQLFAGVKLVEMLFHLRPRRLLRIALTGDPALRRLMRHSFHRTAVVYLSEILEHVQDVVRRRLARPRDPIEAHPATDGAPHAPDRPSFASGWIARVRAG